MGECRSFESLSCGARENDLAKRLLWHGAATKTITELTGWKHSRVTRLRRRLAVPERALKRGLTESSLEVFVRTPSSRSQCAAAAWPCMAYGLLPTRYGPAETDDMHPLGTGERLCDAYEAYQALTPGNELITFNEFALLVSALAKGDEIWLEACQSCGCANLISRSDSGAPTCEVCLRRRPLKLIENIHERS